MDEQSHGWLRIIPAVVALSLSIIYAVGAITIYGQLKAEGVNGVQGMSLVPLEQILGQGIGRVVQQFGNAVISGFIFGCGVVCGSWVAATVVRGDKRGDGVGKGSSRVLRHPGLVALTAVGFLPLVVILVAEVPMKQAAVDLISIMVGFAASVVAMRAVLHREIGIKSSIVAATGVGFLALLISLNIAGAFIRPAPLPHVRLIAADGRPAEGGLLAETGSAWLVVQSNRSIVGVVDRNVRRSFVTYPDREPEQSVLDWFLDRPPSHLLGSSRDG